jgi:hypothetical protein
MVCYVDKLVARIKGKFLPWTLNIVALAPQVTYNLDRVLPRCEFMPFGAKKEVGYRTSFAKVLQGFNCQQNLVSVLERN